MFILIVPFFLLFVTVLKLLIKSLTGMFIVFSIVSRAPVVSYFRGNLISRKCMERAYLDGLKFRDLPKNTLKGTKFRGNCQNTDLREKTVSLRIGTTDYSFLWH